ncbi:hypothetical protein Tco_1519542 [Tanacetum coccineum]
MGEHRKGVVRPKRQKLWLQRFEGGSKLWRVCGFRRGEECLEGYVGAGGGEVNRGGDDFRVSKSLLCEISRVAIGESGGETFRVDGRAV